MLSINVCVAQGNHSSVGSGQGSSSGIGVFEALFDSLLSNSELNQTLLSDDGVNSENELLGPKTDDSFECELKLSFEKMIELGNSINDESSRAEYLVNLNKMITENDDQNQEIVIKSAEKLGQFVSLLEKAGLKLEGVDQKRDFLKYLLKIDAAPIKKEFNFVGMTTETGSNKTAKTQSTTMEMIGIEMVEEKNPFDELKKQRLELEGADELLLGKSSVETRWQVVGVQKANLNIEDLADVFKEQIEKLAEFRIENRQKVSMVLKEQGEELRITLEKQDNVIKIGASVSESMKDRVDEVLLEIKNEMKEKGIEIEIDIDMNEEEESNEEDQREQEQTKDKHSNTQRFKGDNDASNFSSEYSN